MKKGRQDRIAETLTFKAWIIIGEEAVCVRKKKYSFTIFLFFCTGFAWKIYFLVYLCERYFRIWLQQSKTSQT